MPLLFLEEYLDTIVALPSEVQRNLSQIKEQDALFNENSDQMSKSIHKVLDEHNNLTPAETCELLDQIKEGLLKGLSHAEEKVALADNIHETVRGHIVKLEDDLKHFEDEVRLAKFQEGNQTIVHDRHEEDINHLDEQQSIGKLKKRIKSKEEPAMNEGRKRSKGSLSNPEGTHRKVQPPSSNEHGSEPTYCYCKQPAYGEMIGCDANTDCEIEWFHYGCVGLETPPKDQWFCPACSSRLARDPMGVNKEGNRVPKLAFVK